LEWVLEMNEKKLVKNGDKSDDSETKHSREMFILQIGKGIG